ncbi:hypothetical protein Vau01_037160 [Virgisporangium aurantiacum]|uniref:Uncharacterized protein n=1 Tax=Virgisporangium aurantiacum TaxID=175570 RepID=A0A8J4DZ09_9ACTN|nr:hypothetical protein Vau01_037160 [Virgisporangium aurantiacum]
MQDNAASHVGITHRATPPPQRSTPDNTLRRQWTTHLTGPELRTSTKVPARGHLSTNHWTSDVPPCQRLEGHWAVTVEGGGKTYRVRIPHEDPSDWTMSVDMD